MTGTGTALLMAAVKSMSKPDCVPSRSTEVSRISPAPMATPRHAHSIGFTLCIDSQHHGLRAEFSGKFAKQFGVLDGGGVYGDFVGAGAHDGARLFEGADPAAGGQGNGELLGGAADGFKEGGAVVARGGDVEDHEFVGALGVVAGGEFDGIAGVAEAFKVNAFDDAGAVGVEARNEAVGEAHAAARRKLFRTCAPAAPLFSG